MDVPVRIEPPRTLQPLLLPLVAVGIVPFWIVQRLNPRDMYRFSFGMTPNDRQRSVLLISHRFSSVRSANRVYVLEHCRVVEHRTHQELMAEDGLYAELFTLQARQYLSSS